MNTLLWGLLIGLAVFWLIRMMRGGGCCGGEENDDRSDHRKRESSRSEPGVQKIDTAVDPVCGMTLDKETAAHTMPYIGRIYSFCSSDCYEAFKADPEKYLSKHAHAQGVSHS